MKINKFLEKIKSLPLIVKLLTTIIILATGYFIFTKINTNKTPTTTYQTETVEKGTLVVTVTGSGTVSSTNSANVNTKASGVVKAVYFKDGDNVKTGDVIAEIDLDLEGQQNASAALASYQSAKNNLDSAKTALYTLQSDMLANWKDHYELATSSTYQNSDGTPNTENRTLAEYHISDDNWLASEAKYKNQQNVVQAAQTSLNSSWLSYQQSSGMIYAPISGKVSGLSLQVGSVISGSNSSSSSSSSTSSSTKIASIKTDAPPTISINLTEIDVPKIKVGNKATVTFDALTDKTFTGKVISVDTTGSVSSNVTTYPATILLDNQTSEILPNMAASATIITNIKNNVLSVATSALEKQDDGTYQVKIMKNGKPQSSEVSIGIASDSRTEITSGLNGGETVVTGTTTLGGTTSTRSSSSGQSVFSQFGSAGGGMRIAR
ncbi:MAG: efflux RND transporter periplasmic adaptor subunit [Patescibacteria group bacterium]